MKDFVLSNFIFRPPHSDEKNHPAQQIDRLKKNPQVKSGY